MLLGRNIFLHCFPVIFGRFPQIWYFGLSSDISKKKDALKLEFLKKKYQHCYGKNFQRYCDFDDLKQNENESVAYFINRLYTITENLDINDDMKMAKLRTRCKPELIHLFGKELKTLAETERALRSAEAIHDFLRKSDEEEKQKVMQQFQTPYR